MNARQTSFEPLAAAGLFSSVGETPAEKPYARHDGWNEGGKDEWLTPPSILSALGSFDLDPCSPVNRPWPTAAMHYTWKDNGLLKPWEGRVWCNPPYGLVINKWLARMAEHRNGIVMIFARTESEYWHKFVWPHADAYLFLRGRVRFCNVDGTVGPNWGPAPSVLVAYGSQNVEVLRGCGLNGAFLKADFKEENAEVSDR